MRRLDADQLRFLEETSRDYEIALMEDPRVLSYLDGRGVSTASRDRFRLGLVADPPPEHAKVRGRLAIPTLKRSGVTGFKFRCVREECIEQGACIGHGKYLTYEPQSMYNVAALDTDAGYLAICEGEMDALILDGECGIPSIALPGVNSWESHSYWRRLLKDFSRIWIFADNDQGKAKNVGKEFAEFLVEKLPQSVIVELPAEDGEKADVNSVFVRRGRQHLRDLIGLK